MSLLEVSVATGASGPVLVLAGEADITSITRLDEALTAQTSRQAVRLTIDATNLRYADSASVTTLVMAAIKVKTRNGNATLLNPQPPVARILELLCADQTFSIRRRAGRETEGPPMVGDNIPRESARQATLGDVEIRKKYGLHSGGECWVKETERRRRQFIRAYHPDRGGDPDEFMAGLRAFGAGQAPLDPPMVVVVRHRGWPARLMIAVAGCFHRGRKPSRVR